MFSKNMENKIVILSGGFDPIHSGHIAMFEEASQIGDVVVLLNSDSWLIRKKGSFFMDWQDRESVARNIKGVIDVLPFNDDDGTAVQGILDVTKKYSGRHICFGNGGDRTEKTTPEKSFCAENDIEEIFNVGGGKTQSSSNILDNWRDSPRSRPWGEWHSYREFKINNAKAKIKSLIVKPGKELSYQKHNFRNEHWFVIKGNATVVLNEKEYDVPTFNVFDIKVGEWHQLKNKGTEELIVVEVQFGPECVEEDIERK
ncbi:MAG: cupin domain-containing protein [Candidatus Dadabacteria bacterium]|nr:MAG: cupin domain-containing protein [Candidatus Dadabacteria bacterium]